MASWLKQIPDPLRADFHYCREMVRAHGENFPVGSLFAPRPLRPHLHALYAFARSADDFADQPGRADAEKLQLLDDWERRLGAAARGEPVDHPIFRALAHTLKVTPVTPEPLQHLLIAFRMDVTNKRYEDLGELRDYCRYSANPVGHMVLMLAGAMTPENRVCSDAICTALQWANHWQDLGIDPHKGRPLYLPRQEMQRHGVSEEMILNRRFSAGAAMLMLSLVEETRALFQAGAPLIARLDWPLNLEIAVTWEAGMRLLDRIEERGGNTLRARPRLSRHDMALAVWRALKRVSR
ncbi:MAG: squalene synthase HpnC [Magnetococcus sp. WYHC-3]